MQSRKENINTIKLFVLPDYQKELFNFLKKEAWIKTFYLAGGTALALQLGHRESIDFDFFSNAAIDKNIIFSNLKKYGDFDLYTEGEDTIHGSLNNVEISFFRIEDKLIEEPIIENNILIAKKIDIALLKLNAISGRGSKKDFIDLCFLIEEYPLLLLLEKYELKYGAGLANNYHMLKSLTYFDDAEKQAMPKMIKKKSWETIKKEIVSEVKRSNILI